MVAAAFSMNEESPQNRRHLSRFPQFTLRRMPVSVSLVCVYLGLWNLTATIGVRHAVQRAWGEDVDPDDVGSDYSVPMPMVVRLFVSYPVGPGSIVMMRRYYLWYFADVILLPFQEEPPLPKLERVQSESECCNGREKKE